MRARSPRARGRSGELEVLEALLKAGAKANTRDNDGDTPVHYASAQGHVDCIRALAAAVGGCDLEAVDNDGETPLDVAARRARRGAARRAGVAAALTPVCVCGRSARVRTVLRGLIADAAKAGEASDEEGEGEWEEASDDETAEALAALDVKDKAPTAAAGKADKAAAGKADKAAAKPSKKK